MSTIKVLFFFLFVACATAKLNPVDPIKTVRLNCLKRHGLTEADVRKAESNLQSIKGYLCCIGLDFGNLNKDGTINVEKTLTNAADILPKEIARPLVECCRDQVYKGQVPPARQVDVKYAEYLTCEKNRLPAELWNLLGKTRTPSYPLFDSCPA